VHANHSFTKLICLLGVLTGAFAIKAEKKAEPVIKTSKQVGMIAGGTGKTKAMLNLYMAEWPPVMG
jgi:hypothetical protein